jgi:uncharacterized Zn finger protein (UPF0148 family)
MNETDVVCPLCGKAAEHFHTRRHVKVVPLHQGPIPGFLGAIKEGGPFGSPAVTTKSGKDLVIGAPDLEKGIHCRNCKMVLFRYEA